MSIIHAVQEAKDLLRGIRDFLKWQAEHDASREDAARRHSFHVLLLLMGFLGALVGGMSILVYLGRVSGDALLFLVGTVSGWILFTAQRYMFRSEATEDESVLSGLL